MNRALARTGLVKDGGPPRCPQCAQRLAFGTDRRVAAVPTLAAIASHARGPGPIAAVLDARRGEVYAAGFSAGRAASWLTEAVVPIDTLAARAWPRGEAAAAGDLTPRYLRRAEAEVKRTGQRFER